MLLRIGEGFFCVGRIRLCRHPCLHTDSGVWTWGLTLVTLRAEPVPRGYHSVLSARCVSHKHVLSAMKHICSMGCAAGNTAETLFCDVCAACMWIYIACDDIGRACAVKFRYAPCCMSHLDVMHVHNATRMHIHTYVHIYSHKLQITIALFMWVFLHVLA